MCYLSVARKEPIRLLCYHHHHHHHCAAIGTYGAASTSAYLALSSARWYPFSSRLVRLSSSSTSFPFVGFPGGDTQCPLVSLYSADMPCPGPQINYEKCLKDYNLSTLGAMRLKNACFRILVDFSYIFRIHKVYFTHSNSKKWCMRTFK